MTKKRSVSTLYLSITLSLCTLVVFLAGATLIVVNTQHHNEMIDQVSERVSDQLKDAMISRVDRTISLIHRVHVDSENSLRKQLAKRVREAHQQASNVLSKNADLPLPVQKDIIVDTLRPIRFNFGRSAIFITDIYGELQLNPVNISYEGVTIQQLEADNHLSGDARKWLENMIKQIKSEKELFLEGAAPIIIDGNTNESGSTIGFFKYLEPLDWIIGTRESLEEFEKETKKQLLNVLTGIKYNDRLRLFIADYDSNLLALPGVQTSSEKLALHQVLPENQALINRAIELAKANKSEVIEAKWFNQETKRHEPILLYLSAAADWQWLIGAFIPLSDIEQEIGLNRTRLTDQVEDRVLEIATVLLIAYVIVIVIGLFTYRKIKWHFNLFINHLQHAAHDNHPVEQKNISIKEFDLLAETMNEQLEKRAILQKELERLTQKDPLTDLYNRRRMDELLKLEASRVTRNHSPFSIILCDIDHFKQINDSYGHETGDSVIYAVSEILRASLRQQDFVARWGGEEFLIALPDTGSQQAKTVAEKIRALCENHIVTHAEQRVRFTMTLGIDVFDGSKDIKATIAAADEALYEGKQTGRNTVVGADEKHHA